MHNSIETIRKLLLPVHLLTQTPVWSGFTYFRYKDITPMWIRVKVGLVAPEQKKYEKEKPVDFILKMPTRDLTLWNVVFPGNQNKATQVHCKRQLRKFVSPVLDLLPIDVQTGTKTLSALLSTALIGALSIDTPLMNHLYVKKPTPGKLQENKVTLLPSAPEKGAIVILCNRNIKWKKHFIEHTTKTLFFHNKPVRSNWTGGIKPVPLTPGSELYQLMAEPLQREIVNLETKYNAG
jgi:hypothetical protein